MEPEPQETTQTPFEPSADTSSTSNEHQTAMLTHLSGIILWFIVPLIMWLINKDKPGKDFLTDQSKEALNFQITVTLAGIVAGILSFLPGIGGLLPWAVGIFNLAFCIIAGIAANKGERYRYPVAMRLIS